MKNTTFITTWGAFCYIVMPFGSKNYGQPIYQRTPTTLPHDLMHEEVEVYVYDMIVKSKDMKGYHITLQKFFMRHRKYNMRLTPHKHVPLGKFLGYVTTSRRIEIDLTKIKPILTMPPTKNEKQIRGFLCKIQYISRFISKLTYL